MKERMKKLKPRDINFELYRWRKVRGYSQEKMSKLLGLNFKQQYSEIELGRRYPSVPILVQILRLTGITLEQLYPDLYKGEMECQK